jgi:hypothetical protein
MGTEQDPSPETKTPRALHQIESSTDRLIPAVHPTSTYVRDEDYQIIDVRYSYGRAENSGYIVAE